MDRNKLINYLRKYEWLLPTVILLICNNIVFFIKKPELPFVYHEYIFSILMSALIWRWFYFLGFNFKLIKYFVAFLFAFISSVNYLVYIEFGQFISYAMVDFLDRNPEYINSFGLLFFEEYWYVLLLFLLPIIIVILFSPQNNSKNKKVLYIELILPVIICIPVLNLGVFNNKNIIMPDVSSLNSFFCILNKQKSSRNTIANHERDRLFHENDYDDAPDIYIIVNESLGRNLFKFESEGIYNPCMPKLVNLVNKNPNLWFAFENALASSTATDVSIPSIFTGLAPTNEKSQFYKMPLIWDYMKTINSKYYTIFASPVDFKWAKLEDFLDLRKFNVYLQSTSFPGRIINDLGKDEFYSAQAFSKAIREAPKEVPIFGFYFSNALHAPYQKESVYINKSKFDVSRFCIAQNILDNAIEDIINSITESGRLSRSIIFLIGDHGDSDKINNSGHRLYSFNEEYWSTTLLVCVSEEIQSKYANQFKNFRKNTDSLVGTIDIYPSLVDLFSQSNKSNFIKNRFSGYSLFEQISPDRILIGVSTNGLRSWPQEGFGIAKGKKRMIYNNVKGFSFNDLENDPDQVKNTLKYLPEAEKRFYLDIIQSERELLRILDQN